MRDGGYLPMEGDDRIVSDKTVRDLDLSPTATMPRETPIGDVLKAMKANGAQYMPITTEGAVTHVAEIEFVVRKLSTREFSKTDPISKTVTNKFKKVTLDTPLSHVAISFDVRKYVVALDGDTPYVMTPLDLADVYADN
jgi:hypothetical protein